jgi:hypothetical protein
MVNTKKKTTKTVSQQHKHSRRTLKNNDQTTKQSSKQSTKQSTKQLTNIKDFYNVIKAQADKIKDLDLQSEIEQLERDEKYIQQKSKLQLIKNLVSGLYKNVKFMNRRLSSKTIPIYIPLDKNDLNSCIKAEYNVKKRVESSGSGAFGDVFKTKGKKYTYAVKVIDIDKNEDADFIFQRGKPKDKLTIIENEAEITKKMGDLGIGPKVYDIYHCNDNNKPKYYFVMQYMNQGSLASYMDKNKLKTLKPNLINSIMNKLQKMHDHGYIHNDLHIGNILVNKNKNGTLEFFISDFGLSQNSKKQVQNNQETELMQLKEYLETGRMWGNEDEPTIDYLAKYILANYEIDI